ncbi:MAG: hypothetical protein PHI11_11065 [Gallionella sp.]|nr:hypothetical protein [Gallionella sp.]
MKTKILGTIIVLLFCSSAWSAHAANASQENSKVSVANSLAGLYWCIAPSWSKGTINLLPNGTYQMNGVDAGRYQVVKNEVHFVGSLKTWNNGVAKVEDGNLVFEWKNQDGSMQYFAYRR